MPPRRTSISRRPIWIIGSAIAVFPSTRSAKFLWKPRGKPRSPSIPARTIGASTAHSDSTRPISSRRSRSHWNCRPFANFVSEDFYQRSNGTPGGVGLAVISTEIKATTPLKFIPISYGAWSAYAGVQYYHLDNPGLEDGNQLLGNSLGDPSKRDTNLVSVPFRHHLFLLNRARLLLVRE